MDRSWELRSACKGIDPIIFYPPTDDEAGPAKAVCSLCPVQTDCLEYAISKREHDGVWGGATERERQRIIRRRRRMRAMNKSMNNSGMNNSGAEASAVIGSEVVAETVSQAVSETAAENVSEAVLTGGAVGG